MPNAQITGAIWINVLRRWGVGLTAQPHADRAPRNSAHCALSILSAVGGAAWRWHLIHRLNWQGIISNASVSHLRCLTMSCVDAVDSSASGTAMCQSAVDI